MSNFTHTPALRKPSVDGHRHYLKGFLLRLSERHRKFLDVQASRTGKDVSALIRDMIEREIERQK